MPKEDKMIKGEKIMGILNLGRHDATGNKREELYRESLLFGDSLMFDDVVNLINDDHYCTHQLNYQNRFELAKDIYSSCGFDLSFLDEEYKSYYEAAIYYFKELQNA